MELTPSQALRAVDRIVEWGAFQLALGGGEPTLRKDLWIVASRAADKGLALHVTTSGDELDETLLSRLMPSLTSLQIGIRTGDLLYDPPAGQIGRIRQICRCTEDQNLHIGANLVLCRTVISRIEEALDRLVETGIRNVTLLRYKPPASLEQWMRESPTWRELHGTEDRIARVASRYPGLALRLDCALAFLQRDVQAPVARRAGLFGCVAGSRIAAISPDGSIYPCSQLVDPRFMAGNIARDDLTRIWRDSEILRRFRRFRSSKLFRRSACGECDARERCGGCRVFTHDGFGPDPGCPGARIEARGQQVQGERRV